MIFHHFEKCFFTVVKESKLIERGYMEEDIEPVIWDVAKAVKVSGSRVQLRPEEFERLISRTVRDRLVISSQKRFFSRTFQYLTSYKGFTFYTESAKPLSFPVTHDTIEAEKIKF